MIALVLLFQLNMDVVFRQAIEGINSAKNYTAREMDTAGRARLRTESLVVLELVDDLREARENLRACREMQERVRREP